MRSGAAVTLYTYSGQAETGQNKQEGKKVLVR